MIPETCWDRSLIINIGLVASCWFISLHPKNLKFSFLKEKVILLPHYYNKGFLYQIRGKGCKIVPCGGKKQIRLCASYLFLFIHYNQQDATIFYYLFLKSPKYFGRFFRSSSRAYNCTFSLRYCQPILLQTDIVDERELCSISSKIPACSGIGWQYL
jgi:hypothetical protein